MHKQFIINGGVTIEVQKGSMVIRVTHSAWGVCSWESTCGKVIFLFVNLN